MLKVFAFSSNFTRLLQKSCKHFPFNIVPPMSKEDSKAAIICPNVSYKYANINTEGRNIISSGSKLSGIISIGYGSTIGMYNQVFGGDIRIGRYCQFGPCVGIYALNHPYTHLTSYLNNSLFEGRLKQHQSSEAVVVGNDVWIGHGAVILPNITVGDGAVIGAGAIVTKDVGDFSVVVGNPAREIKKRFDEETVSLIQSLKWWNRTPEELMKMESLFHVDLSVETEKGKEMIRTFLSDN